MILAHRTVSLQDYLSTTTFSVSVDVTWTGTGTVSRSVSTNHFQSHGFSATEHAKGGFAAMSTYQPDLESVKDDPSMSE